MRVLLPWPLGEVALSGLAAGRRREQPATYRLRAGRFLAGRTGTASGTGRLIPASEVTATGTSGPGTLTGSDTLTVSTTSVGLTRSVSLTLVVQ